MDFNQIFSVNDTDKGLQGKASGNFGLNGPVNVTKLEYTNRAGKKDEAGNPTEGHAFDIHVQVKDREYNLRIYDPTGSDMLDKDGKPVKQGEPGYDVLFKADGIQRVAVVKHAIKSVGVTDVQIAAIVPTVTSFTDFFQKLATLVPAQFQTKQVDAFLEYQWNPSEGQTMTFLQLPRNMKGGPFLIPHVPGVFKETINSDGSLSYVDASGNKHPFERNDGYMDSNKAIQQGVANTRATNSAATPAGGTAQSSTW